MSELFDKREIRELTRSSDWRGLLSVTVTWGIIGGAMALVTVVPHPSTVALALVLIAGRQLGLAVLMHEASHRSLFRTRWLNEALRELTDREQTIIRRRRLREEGDTLEELGKSLGVSKERVRQLEQRAMDKLRDHIERRVERDTTAANSIVVDSRIDKAWIAWLAVAAPLTNRAAVAAAVFA